MSLKVHESNEWFMRVLNCTKNVFYKAFELLCCFMFISYFNINFIFNFNKKNYVNLIYLFNPYIPFSQIFNLRNVYFNSAKP